MTKEFKPETEKCPICDTKWTKTTFGAKVWYDCKPCNKTAEDIVVLKKSSPSGTKEYRLGSLEEWEEFISELEFDDDDWGYPFLKMTMAEKANICDDLLKQEVITNSNEWMDWYYGL